MRSATNWKTVENFHLRCKQSAVELIRDRIDFPWLAPERRVCSRMLQPLPRMLSHLGTPCLSASVYECVSTNISSHFWLMLKWVIVILPYIYQHWRYVICFGQEYDFSPRRDVVLVKRRYGNANYIFLWFRTKKLINDLVNTSNCVWRFSWLNVILIFEYRVFKPEIQ